MAGREVFGAEELQEVTQVLKSGVLFRYGFDKERGGVFKVKQFEETFAGYLNTSHALGVSSGSAALKVALEAMNLPRGKEVLTSCFTFVATIEAIEEAGLKPVLCDIDETLNISPESIKNKITKETVCVVPVHMMGAAADMTGILQIARENNIKVLEDACQSTGADLHGKKAGTFGDAGCFSFDYVKVMTAGEGGMLVTDNEELYKQAEFYHDHGHPHLEGVGRGEEKRARKGFNYRMNEIQGAIGLAQLKKLADIIAGQRENKKAITGAMANHDLLTFRPMADREGEIATFLTVLLPDAEKAEKFKQALKETGTIPATLNYWHFGANIEIAGGSFPMSKAILDRSVSLEIKTVMGADAIEKTVASINNAVSKVF